VFSGQKSASVSTAAQFRMMRSCKQVQTLFLCSNSFITNLNAGGWSGHAAAPLLLHWRLLDQARLPAISENGQGRFVSSLPPLSFCRTRLKGEIR
jgi:hypothetical protein